MLRVVLRDVSDTFATRADESFQGQIVARCQRIVLVGLNETTCVLPSRLVERVLIKNDLELAEIHRDRVRSDNDSRVVLDIFDLPEPRVRSDITSRESFIRVGVKDLLEQVAAIVTDELRNGVLGIQDLFVQNIGFRVFKWQITANHGVENDSTRPNVCGQPMVVLPGDHLGRSIARTATRSFESLTWSVCI